MSKSRSKIRDLFGKDKTPDAKTPKFDSPELKSSYSGKTVSYAHNEEYENPKSKKAAAPPITKGYVAPITKGYVPPMTKGYVPPMTKGYVPPMTKGYVAPTKPSPGTTKGKYTSNIGSEYSSNKKPTGSIPHFRGNVKKGQTKKSKASYDPDELTSSTIEFGPVSMESEDEPVEIATKMKKLAKQVSINNNEIHRDKGIHKVRTSSMAKKSKRTLDFLERTPPSQNIPYNLDLSEENPVRGLAHIVSLNWGAPDVDGEIKSLKDSMRAMKYEVVCTNGIDKQGLLNMKDEWGRKLQTLKYPSFIAILIGSSDTEQNFVTTDNKLLSRDEILHGLDNSFPHVIPKLLFFNSLVPSSSTNIVQDIPKNTLYIHTYLDARLHGPRADVTHPFLDTLYDVIRTKGSNDEFQEMIRRAKHTCLSTFTYYTELKIRQHSTLLRPLFLMPEEVQKNVNAMSYFSMEQAYPISSSPKHGLVVMGLIEDPAWYQTARYQKPARSTYNNLKTSLEFYNLQVSTFELHSKFDYKNDLLKEVRSNHSQYDIIIIIMLGTSASENYFKFRSGNEQLSIGEILEDMRVIAPDRPKVLFISQLLHLDSRESSTKLLQHNLMQSEETAPYIHNSYIFHAKNITTNSIEGTFLNSLSNAFQSKYRKLEFTKIITHVRLDSGEKNLLPHFLEMNNLERPLYLLPEELKISAELMSRGEEFASLYQEALDDGLELLRFYRLMVVGPEGVGKTSLLRALTGQPFQSNQASTPFIDKFDVQIHKISKDWKQNEDLDSYADRLLDTKEQMAVNYVVYKLKENIRRESSSIFESDTYPLDLYKFCVDDPIEFNKIVTEQSNDTKTESAALESVSSSSGAILTKEVSLDINTSFSPVEECPTELTTSSLDAKLNIEFEIPADDIFPQKVTNLDNMNTVNSKKTEYNTSLSTTTHDIRIPPPPPDIPPEFLPKTRNAFKEADYDADQLEAMDLKENLIDIPINKIYSALHQDAKSQNVEHPDFLTAWDFAGQNYLYCFHSLFLSPRAIYLLLIDLNVKDLNEEINIREERKDRLSQRSYSGVPKTYLEAIEFWLNAIYSVARMPLSEHYSRHSKVVFVFSRADKCDNPNQRAIQHFQTIQDHMIGKSNAFSIVHMNINTPIVISCKPDSPYLKNINQIKELLEEISDTVAFRQEIPIRWLELARAVLHERSPFISHRRLELLCEKHGCTKDFEPLISLFHDIGFFFYQKGIVIRDIQTFLNIIYHVISPQYGEKIIAKAKEYDRAFLKQDLLDCQNAGRITNKLLNHILLLDDDISHVREEVVQLLLTYGVIIDSQADAKHPFYYVPYLLTGNLEELLALDEDINSIYLSIDDKSSQTFYLYFPDGFIPAAVYFSLLSQCLKFNKSKRQPQPLLGFDCARFQLSHDHSFILDFCSNKSYIRILFNSSLTHSYHLTERLNFLHFIQTHISKIQGNIIPCGNAAKIAVECRCRELYQMKKLVQPCVFLDQLLSTPTGHRTSWCHASQKYEEWNHLFIDKDFCYDMLQREFNSDDLAGFIFENMNVFEEHLDIMILSRQLYFGGLFTANDLSMLLSKENKEMTAEAILAQLLHQSNNWALRFYFCLQRETTHSGHLFLVQFMDSFFFQKRSEQQSTAVETISTDRRKRYAELGGSIMPSEEEFDRYKMNCNPHGIAMIINIETFQEDTSMTRKGSHHDFIKLRETFEQLQYVVLGFEDLTKPQFRKQLSNVRKMDHDKYDSFICVIMSHGDEDDNVITHDKKKISKQEILNEFNPQYCSGLIKKPKIFIFQACRGSKNEGITPTAILPETNEEDQTNLDPFDEEAASTLTDELFLNRELPLVPKYDKSITIHHQSDTFIGNSTVQNYVSYRNPSKGSMFIQSFCKVVQYTRYEEFQHIMNEVRRRVSMLSKKYVQCTEDINHLTAKLYFF